MDLFSTLIASYLEAATNTVHGHVEDVMGVEPQSVVVEYQDMTIPYTYQIWKVREHTVCASYKSKVADYSRCTIAAKALFTDFCQQLSKKQSSHWRHKKAKGMYCLAAKTYQPTMAKISWAPTEEKTSSIRNSKPRERTELEQARADCNLATASAIGSTDPFVLNQRTKKCAHYKSLEQASIQ